ncbi:MAG: pentapeptide repeat-containing protein [Proteobacteria bacterium]|nr:pentapeptide repeat-containing protein [Pseudomonadota bacterium]
MENLMKGLAASIVLVALASAPALACEPAELKAQADCAGANLEEVDLGKLVEAGLISWHLDDIDLEGANLVHADVSYFNMPGANLRDADLGGADLTAVDLRGADLRGASLLGATLTRADLSGADLRNANLENSTIAGAFFFGADLRGVNLSGARQVEREGANFPVVQPALFDGATLPHE